MAIAYPLPDIADAIKIRTFVPALMPAQQQSEDASGTIWVKDLGPERWRGTVETVPMTKADAMRVQALLGTLHGALKRFYIRNGMSPFPQSDPDGAILGASVVKIAALNPNDAFAITLKGLPAGYTLKAGDFFSFDFGTGQRAFHQIAENAVANGLGTTPEFAVLPAIRNGAAIDIVVTLKKPSMLAKLNGLPQYRTDSPLVTSVSFDIEQVLV